MRQTWQRSGCVAAASDTAVVADVEVGPAGIEPATCKSQVQRPAAKPPRNTVWFELLAIDKRTRHVLALVYSSIMVTTFV